MEEVEKLGFFGVILRILTVRDEHHHWKNRPFGEEYVFVIFSKKIQEDASVELEV